MMTVANEQLQLMTVSAAAQLTGLCRPTIAKAMDLWTTTRGRRGLRFVRPAGERRLVRRSELLLWFEQMEREESYG